ncbi:MAG: hypothetical protein MUF35_04890 [Candidatus Nanopelagicales bacterium]|jgi:hypothetical protein|nr:hypothetical protein [Candidatus Nanopelagicales bacterium]
MYGTTISPSSASLAGSAGATTLAATGVQVFWLIVFATAVVLIGMVLMRLRPKSEY